ncbi:hypothetical protein L195_g036300, partial [Trifolium pratense]
GQNGNKTMAKRGLACKGKEEEGKIVFSKCWKNKFLTKETLGASRDYSSWEQFASKC